MSDVLKVKWSKKENDLLISYPRSCDGHYIHSALCSTRFGYDGEERPSVADELEKRGYDIKTLRFEIKMKENHDTT